MCGKYKAYQSSAAEGLNELFAFHTGKITKFKVLLGFDIAPSSRKSIDRRIEFPWSPLHTFSAIRATSVTQNTPLTLV
ncbi:MAG: hypothetical protein CK532_02565 [Flavobacteriales bacterium]|nr:MAG: hypothetical protein CK532_02565 [Flavobacteriales bacterium]